MKKFAVVFVVSLFFVSIAYAVESATTPTADWVVPTDAGTEVGAKKFFCPMDGYTSDKPGKCEKCGMELVEAPAILAEVPAEVPAAPAAE